MCSSQQGFWIGAAGQGHDGIASHAEGQQGLTNILEGQQGVAKGAAGQHGTIFWQGHAGWHGQA